VKRGIGILPMIDGLEAHATRQGLDSPSYHVIMIRIPTDRAPTHPGEMLLEEFLEPMGLTQRQLAQAIHVPYQRVNEIISGRRGMTPAAALRLERYLGMLSRFWMDLQLRWDLYHAHAQDRKELEAIEPYTSTTSP
jgi:addiction module HigA family antidote